MIKLLGGIDLSNLFRRDSAESIVRSLAGGQSPQVGQTIIFTEKGWTFGKAGGTGSLSFVQVTDDPYNATGDGTTNDTAAIQAAIDDVAGTDSGGLVYFPAGTYMVTQLQLRSRVILMGVGWRSTIKQLPNQHTQVDSGTSSGGNGSTTLNDTSKAWGANAFKNYTVRITAGTGAGQRRIIASNTATQLTVRDNWTTIPDSTSQYQILQPRHLIVLGAQNVEFSGICDMVLDGNRPNQLAQNHGVFLLNTGGGPLMFDTHHYFSNLLIRSCSGSGWVKGRDCREARLYAVRTEGCEEYGFDNETDASNFGGSDTYFFSCTAAHNGKSGFHCFGSDLYVGCKAFGNGQRQISGNGAGFLVDMQSSVLVGCWAQENWQDGYRIIGGNGCVLSGCWADANGNNGFTLASVQDLYVSGSVTSQPGLAFQTTNGVSIQGTDVDKCVIEVQVRASEITGQQLHLTNPLNADVWCRVNNRWYGRLQEVKGSVGSDDEHFVFGKIGSPAAGNPAYYLETSNETVPVGSIQGFDGTTTKVFARLNYGNSELELGSSNVNVRLLPQQLIVFNQVVAQIRVQSWDNNPALMFERRASGGGTVTSGMHLGAVAAFGWDGSAFVQRGAIAFVVDGAVSSGNVPTRIEFHTGSSAQAERMRLLSDGKLLIGGTTDGGGQLLQVYGYLRLNEQIDIYYSTGQPGFVAAKKDGVLRWRFGSDGSSESGGNAGSDFAIFRYSDDGVFLGNAFKIRRSDGNVSIGGAISGDKLRVYGEIQATDRLKILPQAGSVAFVQTKSPGDVVRWQFGQNNESESGSNTGSNFVIERYSDTGALLGTVAKIRRSDGAVFLPSDILIVGHDAVSGSYGAGQVFVEITGNNSTTTFSIFDKTADPSGLALSVVPATAVNITATRIGVGSFLPLRFFVGGSQRLEITTGGTVNIAGSLTLGVALGAIYGGTGQNTTAAGDLLYSNAANSWARLPIGANGQVLTVVSGLPAWANPSGGGSLALNDLTDVTIISPQVGQFLHYNGSQWINNTPQGGGLVLGTGRAVNTGVGLTGGGTLGVDRTISIDTAIVPRKDVSETISQRWTFNAGLTVQGGGTFPLDVNGRGQFDQQIDIETTAGVAGLVAITRNGTLRWRFGSDGSAEFGSDTGNDFSIFRYSDGGSFVGTVVKIVRSDATNPVYIHTGGALRQVQVGNPDSGGIGFRVLIVPN